MRKFYLRPDIDAKRAERAKSDYRSAGDADRLMQTTMSAIYNRFEMHDIDWRMRKLRSVAAYMERKTAMIRAAYFLQRQGRDFFDRKG